LFNKGFSEEDLLLRRTKLDGSIAEIFSIQLFTNSIRFEITYKTYIHLFHFVSFRVLSGFMDEFNYKSNKLLEKLRKFADGKTVVSLFDQFSCTAMDIISHVAFGMVTNFFDFIICMRFDFLNKIIN